MSESDGRVMAKIENWGMMAGRGHISLEHIGNRLMSLGLWLSGVNCTENWIIIHRMSQASGQGDMNTIIRRLRDVLVTHSQQTQLHCHVFQCQCESLHAYHKKPYYVDSILP